MDSNLVSALLGLAAAVLAAVTAGVPIVVRRRQQRNRQLYKLAYVQVVHLARDEDPPVYTAEVPRLDERRRQVDVRDEVQLFRLNVFPTARSGFCSRDRSTGTVDLLILQPYQEQLVFADRDSGLVPGQVEQVLEPSTNVVFTKSTYYNGLGHGHEDFAVRVECDTDEARLVFDLSSLPGRETLITAPPRGVVVRGSREESRGVAEPRPGVYCLDARDLKTGDVLRIDLALDRSGASQAVLR